MGKFASVSRLRGGLLKVHLGGWRNSGRAGRRTETTGETEASEPAAAWGGVR